MVEESTARYPLTIDPIAQQAYLKASNTGAGDRFGFSVAVSGDTVVIGAPYARFSSPTGAVVDIAGNLFVTDSGNHTIRKITLAGLVTTFAGTPGAAGSTNGSGGAARFNHPAGIAVVPSGGLMVADTDNHSIRKVTAAGDVTSIGGLDGTNGDADGTGTAARFDKPSALTINGAGTVFVIDTNNCRVSKSTSTTKSNAAPAWPASSLTRTPSCASSPPS